MKDMTATASAQSPVPVFVELFTSEGCSSCPPADELLSKIIGKGALPGTEIIALAWHVDYWDGLGWKDPLSSRAATERQNHYVSLLHQQSAYTPEMVVGGALGLVGSDASAVSSGIRAAQKQPISRVELKASNASESAKGKLEAQIPALVSLANGEESAVMLAVTEDGIEHSVRSGENGGRKLHHDAAVRDAKRIGMIKGGSAASSISADWALPAGVRADRSRLVVWVESKDGRALAAGQIAVKTAS